MPKIYALKLHLMRSRNQHNQQELKSILESAAPQVVPNYEYQDDDNMDAIDIGPYINYGESTGDPYHESNNNNSSYSNSNNDNITQEDDCSSNIDTSDSHLHQDTTDGDIDQIWDESQPMNATSRNGDENSNSSLSSSSPERRNSDQPPQTNGSLDLSYRNSVPVTRDLHLFASEEPLELTVRSQQGKEACSLNVAFEENDCLYFCFVMTLLKTIVLKILLSSRLPFHASSVTSHTRFMRTNICAMLYYILSLL